MNKKKIIFAVFMSFALLFCPPAHADETALFSTIAPDALIILDLSGSMNWTPYGETMYTATGVDCFASTSDLFYGESGAGHTQACTIMSGSVPKYGDATCMGPFARTLGIAGTTDCSRVAIARRTLFDILDDNDSNTITSADDQSLNVRIGYMRFTTGDDEAGDPRTGNIQIPTSPTDMGIGARYSRLYCNNATTCASTAYVAGTISGATASGGTPLADALYEARVYLDAHKASDSARACRQKFVILISDGSDTFECNGNGTEGQTDQYTRRRASVKRVKDLADQGYKVFVIGFGIPMPHYLRNTLNWMAYWGGTDNPGVPNDGNTGAYNPDTFATLCPTSADVTHHNIDGDGDHYYASTNDPGETSLSGYAFLTANSAQLTEALKYAINIIREATYSFTQASVASSRLMDENYLYEGSFQPINGDPFWLGHLKKYQINADGTVGGQLWDAGEELEGTTPGNRTIFTLINGTKTEFTTSNITRLHLGVANDTERNKVVGYFRGEDSYNPEHWKLGDVFRATPINIGTPSPYYFDIRDQAHAFNTFRENNPRTSANGLRLVVTGANDGQLHAFRTSNGSEAWSFIPPNLLDKLKNVAHTTHPATTLSHQYFVDGPVTVADVWMGYDPGTNKSPNDWRTLLVSAEGRGGGTRLWSSAADCAPATGVTYSAVYTAATSNYCGFWAFDVTTPANPVYKWRLQASAAQGPYLGDPWSKFYVGRVRIGTNEKWVGFIGGGYNGSDCAGGGDCDTRGKGFFVVDLQNGNILWSYNLGQNGTMVYSLAGSPAIADTDNDNFIDTAYIGDLGGNVWRFKFCSTADGDNCGYGNWQGTKLFDSSTGTIRPIYTTPSVTLDRRGRIWVYFGTGDKMDPTASNAQEKFYAVKDYDRTTTFRINDLENITTGTYTDSDNKRGWYINLAGSGEKILADPAVFGNVAYFTTYVPPSGGDPCSQAGTARLYAVNYVSGGGILGGGRSMDIGVGVPTAPVLSFKPGGSGSPDLYVTVSGGSGQSASTLRAPMEPPSVANRANVLYWRDTKL
jgi:hypothetical protein